MSKKFQPDSRVHETTKSFRITRKTKQFLFEKSPNSPKTQKR